MSTQALSLSSTTGDVRLAHNCRDFSIARLLDSQHHYSASRNLVVPLDLRCSSGSDSSRKLEEHRDSDVGERCMQSVDRQVRHEERLDGAARDTELGHQSSGQRVGRRHHLQLLMLPERAGDDGRMSLGASVDEQRQITHGHIQHRSETSRVQGPYSHPF